MLSHTHTHNSFTQTSTHNSLTRNSLTHNCSQTILSHANCHTHTTLAHTAFHTKLFYTQLFHRLPFTHDSFTYNIVTHRLSLSHIALSHTTLSHTALSIIHSSFTSSVFHHLLYLSPSHFQTCFELVGRSWHVGLSGPLIFTWQESQMRGSSWLTWHFQHDTSWRLQEVEEAWRTRAAAPFSCPGFRPGSS